MEKNYTPLPMMGTILQQGETSATLAQKISNLITETSLSKMQEEYEKLKALMSCYQCVLLEVETKFRVLNEQFSLNHERNPIDTIKTRIKSPESILEKLQRKGLPFTAACIW